MPALAVVFNSIRIDNDHDGWTRGDGDIYLDFNINDGLNHENGHLGEYSIGSGDSETIGETVAVFDDVDTLISLNVSVWDNDWPDADDHLGDLNLTFDASQNFGIGHHEFVDVGDYALDFSIVPVV